MWSEQQKLIAGDGANGDQFGTSVSVSGDTAVVSAVEDDDIGPIEGAGLGAHREAVPDFLEAGDPLPQTEGDPLFAQAVVGLVGVDRRDLGDRLHVSSKRGLILDVGQPQGSVVRSEAESVVYQATVAG
ncbi:MAG: FG-GAP repeat protein [Planctomycetes bacterium]|nr:FG-GAP repeat protein [Planctomycetota bacterium]